MPECFDLALKDGVAHLRMNRPEAMNTMTPAFWRELPALVNELSDAGEARVIVLANHPDNEEALALFAVGIRGYCNAHATVANLRQVANVVRQGGLWIGETLMQRLLVSTQAALSHGAIGGATSDAAAGASAASLSALTKREQEVARAVASGSSRFTACQSAVTICSLFGGKNSKET